MVVQIKKLNKYFITALISLSCLTLKAQDKQCIRFTQNICKKNFAVGDTIKVSFENLGNDTLDYNLAVMMYDGKEWSYSPYYTKYFNFELSYAKMMKMFSSKFPVTFSQDEAGKSRILLPHEIDTISFVVEKKESYRRLIKFRLDVAEKVSLDAIEDCNFVYSDSFYFLRIKE